MNSKKWNRVITSAATVSLALGTLAPAAFAASTAGVQYNTRTMTVGKGYEAVIQGVVAKDSGNYTEFLPIYYLMQGLGINNYTVNWDGNSRVLNITIPQGVTFTAPSAAVGAPNAGEMVIQINGTAVTLAPRVVAKDPASGVLTTYAPIYYLNKALATVGFANTYNGQSWGMTPPTPVVTPVSTTPALSDLTFTGEAQGTGAKTAPAVSTNGQVITATTKLTDQNGNPVSGVTVDFNVSSKTNLTVNSNGLIVQPGSANSDGTYPYQATTDSTGTATITMAASGNESYSVYAEAPFSVNNANITSSTSYVEFGQPGGIVISPETASQNFGTVTSVATGVIPITATLIPQAGQSAANIPVTFTITGTNTANAYLSNSTGGSLKTDVAYTNSQGQATIWIDAQQAGTATVQAVATNYSSATTGTLTWAQAGTVTSIANAQTSSSASPLQANVGQQVTLSGQAQDALGNPVPNAQLLVTGYDPKNGNSNYTLADSYVNGSTSTVFPNVGTSVGGANASTTFGDLITTDASGNFSLTVTDTNATKDQFQVYSVNNGVIGTDYEDYYVNFTQSSSTLNNLYVDTTSTGLANGSPLAANNKYTKLTGLGYQEGSTSTTAPVYVGGFGGSTPYAPASGSVQYTVSANNKGYVNAVDGVLLNGTSGYPNQPSSVVVNVTYSSTGAISATTVDGVAIPAADLATTGAFTFVPGDSNVENDTFTVSTGSLSDTVGANFSAGVASELGNAGSFTVSPGQSQTVTFTVEDANGNPVPNGSVQVKPTNDISNLWITAVNGVALSQTEYGTNNVVYGTQPTPIPLFSTSSLSPALGYSSVYSSGQVSATNIGGGTSQSTQVYANASGQVTITFTAGGNGYWPVTNQVYGASNAASGQVVYFSYDSNGNILLTLNSAPASNGVGSLSF